MLTGAIRKGIGKTSTIAESSLKKLRRNKVSILSTIALGILLEPLKFSNGWCVLCYSSLPLPLYYLLNVFQGGAAMMSQQGGFKEVVKKSFPEADFSHWSMSLNPLIVESQYRLATNSEQTRTIPRDSEL